MIVRLGLLVGASIAAYTVRQINVRGPKPSNSSLKHTDDDDEATIELDQEKEEKETLDYSNISSDEKEQEEEKEEVKLISGEINPPSVNTFDIGEDEFEELLSGQIEFPVPDAEKSDRADRQRIYDEEMASNANELERLRNLVKELE